MNKISIDTQRVDLLRIITDNIDKFDKILSNGSGEAIIALKMIGMENYEKESFCKTIADMDNQKLMIFCNFVSGSLKRE